MFEDISAENWKIPLCENRLEVEIGNEGWAMKLIYTTI